MRYILNDEYRLCGWKNARFAIMNVKKGTSRPVTERHFELLFKCSGKKEILPEELGEGEQEFFDFLLKDNVIREAKDGEKRTLTYTEYQGIYKNNVQWSITGRCNYRCRHCFQSAPEGILGEPTLEQCFDIIHQLHDCGIMNVAITGGEPLVRKDFFKIIDELLRLNMHVSTIYSNGKLITDEFLDELEHRNIKPGFQISFDGVGCHDWMRGVEGAEELALAAMKRLRERGFSFSSAMCLCRENVGSIRETVKKLGEAGCAGLKFQRSMPQGEWAKETEHFLSYEETLQAYLDYLPLYKEDGMPVDIQMEGFFSYTKGKGYRSLSDRHGKEELLDKLPPCGVIRTTLYVGPNGAVTPCMSMCGAEIEKQFPNLFETPLKDILTESSYTKLTSYKVSDVFNHNKKCHACKFRCQCCTGCRAFAVGAEGNDYLGIDPITCMILTGGWDTRLVETADRLFEKETFGKENPEETTGKEC